MDNVQKLNNPECYAPTSIRSWYGSYHPFYETYTLLRHARIMRRLVTRAIYSPEAYTAIWLYNNGYILCKCANYLRRSRYREITHYSILVMSGCPWSLGKMTDDDESSDSITLHQPTLTRGKKRPRNWIGPRGSPPPLPPCPSCS
jgi:hypothetical protein